MRTESAASIKRRSPHKAKPATQLPREGSQLRAFYDALKGASSTGNFVPRYLFPDASRVSSHIYNLSVFYGLDIVTIRERARGRGKGWPKVVGWYVSGEWQGLEYVRYPLPGVVEVEDQGTHPL